ALRGLAGAQRTGRRGLARNAAAARALPDTSARAGARASGRAVQRARRGGRGGARPRARRAAREPDAPRREPHPRPDRGTRPRPAGAGMRRYFSDVVVLARKDLVLEFRARDTLPAMLLFVVSV